MDVKTLKQKCKKFEKLEGRASFYDVAGTIVDKHPLHASIIILATWNASRFRFMASDTQNLDNLKKAIDKCTPLFEKIKYKDIQTAELDDIAKTVKHIYSILSKVKGVEYTGASKVMHLINRNLFVMWDGYIRDSYGLGNNSVDYVNFLKNVQSQVKNIKWNNPTKTLAKAIDEYNYMTFSYPNPKKSKNSTQP